MEIPVNDTMFDNILSVASVSNGKIVLDISSSLYSIVDASYANVIGSPNFMAELCYSNVTVMGDTETDDITLAFRNRELQVERDGLINGNTYLFYIRFKSSSRSNVVYYTNGATAYPQTVPDAPILSYVGVNKGIVVTETIMDRCSSRDGFSDITSITFTLKSMKRGVPPRVIERTYEPYTYAENPYFLGGLENDIDYLVSAHFTNGQGMSEDSSMNLVRVSPLPDAMQGLSASVSDGVLSLHWTPAASASGYNLNTGALDASSVVVNYKIQISTDDMNYTLVENANASAGNNYNVLMPLAPGTLYHFRVTPVNLYGASETFSSVFQTYFNKPGSVVGLSGDTDLVNNTLDVTLNWQPPSNDIGLPIDHYLASYGSVVATVPANTLTHTFNTGNLPGTNVTFNVRAVVVDPQRGLVEPTREVIGSNTNIVVKLFEKAHAFNQFSSFSGNHTVTLQWQPDSVLGGASSVHRYSVVRVLDGVDTVLDSNLSGSSTSYTDTGLVNGLDYSYKVTPFTLDTNSNIQIEGVINTIVPKTPYDLPYAVTDVTASTQYENLSDLPKIKVAWTLPTFLASDTTSIYNGNVALPDIKLTRVAQMPMGPSVTTVLTVPSSLPYVDSNVQEGYMYTYKVALRATDPFTNEIRSLDTTSNTATAFTVADQLSAIYNSIDLSGNIDLSWSKPDGHGLPIAGYHFTTNLDAPYHSFDILDQATMQQTSTIAVSDVAINGESIIGKYVVINIAPYTIYNDTVAGKPPVRITGQALSAKNANSGLPTGILSYVSPDPVTSLYAVDSITNSASQINPSSISNELFWTAPVFKGGLDVAGNGRVLYYITRSDNTGVVTDLTPDGTSATSYLDNSGLVNGIRYTYSVTVTTKGDVHRTDSTLDGSVLAVKSSSAVTVVGGPQASPTIVSTTISSVTPGQVTVLAQGNGSNISQYIAIAIPGANQSSTSAANLFVTGVPSLPAYDGLNSLQSLTFTFSGFVQPPAGVLVILSNAVGMTYDSTYSGVDYSSLDAALGSSIADSMVGQPVAPN